MRVQLLGCNHRSAPVDVREQLAFDGDKGGAALNQFSTQFPEIEFVLLSTCNRVELYAASEHPGLTPDFGDLLDFIAQFHKTDRNGFEKHLFNESNRQAIRHLFSVTASLDSLVPGEGQILGQVKQAYESSRAIGLTGPLTNSLFQKAFSVGKKVHTSTQIAQKKVSVSSVAVEFACEIFDPSHFPEKTILLIGAGKMGELTLEHLRELKPGKILVTNRSTEKAVQLANRCDGVAVPFDRLDEWLTEADLILSTTGAREPIVDRTRFDKVMANRGNRPVFIIDIAVPRDFSTEVGNLENVYLYNIDDLEEQRQENLKVRELEVQKGQDIVDRETEVFIREWAYQHHSGPVISQLRSEWDNVRSGELERLFSQCPELTEEDRSRIEHSFERFQNQLLHLPLSTLKTATSESTDPPHGLIDALKRLFHLG